MTSDTLERPLRAAALDEDRALADTLLGSPDLLDLVPADGVVVRLQGRTRSSGAGLPPGVADAVAARVCDAVARLRAAELYKAPGVGETITWARALMAVDDLDGTLGAVLKVREDVERVRAKGVLDGA